MKTCIAAPVIALAAALSLAPTAHSHTEETTQPHAIEREIAVQRAAQAAIWGIPAVGIWDIVVGTRRDLGGDVGDIVYFSKPMESRHGFLTANNVTPYVVASLSTKDGPIVVEVPPAAEKASYFGTFVDAWDAPIADVGPPGDDKSKGGKYLFLPPGYEGEVPDGYFVAKSKTYGVWLGLRARLDADGGNTEAKDLYSRLKIYPLAKADNPPPTELINASGRPMFTVHPENYHLLEELGKLVEEEHPGAVEGGQKFLLASIGMESGKPFAPSAEQKPLLAKAARAGAALLRANMWDFQGDDKYIYKDGKWWNPFVGGVYTFDPKGYLDYDAQAFFAAYATGVTPAVATKTVGIGSQYLCTHTDSKDEPLDGAKSYKLTIPANIPAKGWTGIFRLYGPLEPFFDQSWKLNDIELVR